MRPIGLSKVHLFSSHLRQKWMKQSAAGNRSSCGNSPPHPPSRSGGTYRLTADAGKPRVRPLFFFFQLWIMVGCGSTYRQWQCSSGRQVGPWQCLHSSMDGPCLSFSVCLACCTAWQALPGMTAHGAPALDSVGAAPFCPMELSLAFVAQPRYIDVCIFCFLSSCCFARDRLHLLASGTNVRHKLLLPASNKRRTHCPKNIYMYIF